MATIKPIYCKDNGFQRIQRRQEWNRPFYIFRDFQKGAINQVAQQQSSGLDDGFDVNAGGSIYTDEVTFQGRQVCKCQINEGTKGDAYFGGIINRAFSGIKAGVGETVWVRALIRIPGFFSFEDTFDGGGGMKLLRQGIEPDPNAPITVNGFHADLYIPADAMGYSGPYFGNHEAMTSWTDTNVRENGIRPVGNNATDQPPRDEWYEIQYAITHDTVKSSDGGLCSVKVWQNGELIDDIADIYTMVSDTDEVGSFKFITYYNSGPGGADMYKYIYVAELELTNTTPTTTDSQGNPRLRSKV